MHTVTSEDEQTHNPTTGHSTRIKQSFGYTADQKWYNRTENTQGLGENQLLIKLILSSNKNMVST